MARAAITIVLPEISDDEAIAIKKEIEELVKDRDKVTVSLHLTPR